jgi:16S rRNA (uracil1498-N3)-methyltransferase
MPQFFVPPGGISGGRCVLRGDDFNHLVRVRRIKAGDTLQLRDQQGTLYESRVVHVGESSLVAEIIDKKTGPSVSLDLTLCAALLKGKKFDLVIQKATEVGVSRIIPVKSERAVPDLGGREEERLRRWRRIALEASKQCLRRGVPAVEGVRDLNSLVREPFRGLKIIAHPGGKGGGLRSFLRGAGTFSEAALLVGPEGGFSPAEAEAARSCGWIDLSVGMTQLRAETAAVVLPAILMYEWSPCDEDNGQRPRD